MTRLDKAFIKAYSKTVGPLPAPHLQLDPEPARPAAAPQTPAPADVATAAEAPVAAASKPANAPAAAAHLPAAHEALIASPQPFDYGRVDYQHTTQSPHWPAPAGIAAFARWEPETVTTDTEPVTEPVAEPFVEKAAEPVVVAKAEPVAEQIAKPVIEAVQTIALAAPPAQVLVKPASEEFITGTPVTYAPVPPLSAPDSPPAERETKTEEVETAAPNQPPQAIQRAAFEVDNFIWPEMCRKLTSVATPAWNGLAGELALAATEGQKIVLITSHRRGEGRTTLALCLAKLLTKRHIRVALVDADFHRPQLAGQLKLLPASGWDEVARGEQALTESWVESLADGATLAPLRPRPDSRGLTGNPRVKATLALLREQHDLVLVDAGALDDADDRELLALLGGTAQIDCALVVRDVRDRTTDALAACQRRLDALGITRWDVVENFA